MRNKGAKLYVGCSLTYAPEVFKQSVEKFKGQLREEGHEVFDFVGLENGTPEDVYKWDLGHCVGKCDTLIAICDEPSIGLGWEMSTALTLGKRVLAVAHKDAKVTRMVLGAAAVEEGMSLLRYNDLAEVVPAVNALLDEIAQPIQG